MSYKLSAGEEGVVNKFVRNHFAGVPATPEALKQATEWAIKFVREQMLSPGMAHLPIDTQWDPVINWFRFTIGNEEAPPVQIDVFDTRS